MAETYNDFVRALAQSHTAAFVLGFEAGAVSAQELIEQGYTDNWTNLGSKALYSAWAKPDVQSNVLDLQDRAPEANQALITGISEGIEYKLGQLYAPELYSQGVKA